MSKDYPDEHVFLLSCAESSDFNSEVRACFLKEDTDLAKDICENLSILSESLALSANTQRCFTFDEDTLNYAFNDGFLNRYRSVNDFIDTVPPKLFEDLCAYYLKWLGCSEVRVTRYSNDQGLDFYGVHPFNKDSLFNSVSEPVFLIGQAKLYSSPVGTGEIREFVGSIELIRKQIYSSDTYSYKFATDLKPYALINPIFIASSRFSRDAESLCQKIGIRMIDRVKLITLISSIDDLFDKNHNFQESIFSQKIANIQLAESIST